MSWGCSCGRGTTSRSGLKERPATAVGVIQTIIINGPSRGYVDLYGLVGPLEETMRTTMRTLLCLIAMLVALPVTTANADAVYPSQHIPLHPIGTAPLRTGFVENIHANGPNVYAHEGYAVAGAAPRPTSDGTTTW